MARILLVEDEMLVRELAREDLTRAHEGQNQPERNVDRGREHGADCSRPQDG